MIIKEYSIPYVSKLEQIIYCNKNKTTVFIQIRKTI